MDQSEYGVENHVTGIAVGTQERASVRHRRTEGKTGPGGLSVCGDGTRGARGKRCGYKRVFTLIQHIRLGLV
ncbi:uncharacterized [Tachysurus ichikawai]